jgi:hypothetical protein
VSGTVPEVSHETLELGGQVAKEQKQTVKVAQDGVGAQAAQPREIVGEEPQGRWPSSLRDSKRTMSASHSRRSLGTSVSTIAQTKASSTVGYSWVS